MQNQAMRQLYLIVRIGKSKNNEGQRGVTNPSEFVTVILGPSFWAAEYKLPNHETCQNKRVTVIGLSPCVWSMLVAIQSGTDPQHCTSLLDTRQISENKLSILINIQLCLNPTVNYYFVVWQQEIKIV